MGKKMALIVTLFIFLFPQKVRASREANLYYYTVNRGVDILAEEKIEFDKDITGSQRAYAVFSKLFTSPFNAYIPDNTKLISANINDHVLILNVSEEILKYGGSYNETRIKELIIKNALDLEGVDCVTLLVNGDCVPLPEGSEIDEYRE